MEKAVAVAQETGDREKRAYTLGYLAWVVYFRFDITREGKQPAGDGRRAYGLACQALELGKSWRAQKVLDAEKRAQEIVEGLRRYSGR